MPQTPGAGSLAIEFAVSVPAAGELRIVADDLIAKVAEYCGGAAAGAGEALEQAAAQVAPQGDDDIAFEFRTVERDLVIRARCGNRSSEVRHRLTAT